MQMRFNFRNRVATRTPLISGVDRKRCSHQYLPTLMSNGSHCFRASWRRRIRSCMVNGWALKIGSNVTLLWFTFSSLDNEYLTSSSMFSLSSASPSNAASSKSSRSVPCDSDRANLFRSLSPSPVQFCRRERLLHFNTHSKIPSFQHISSI